ncbi:MAG: hypothetical protein AAGF73_11955 [Actinomycetota bacterium]
MRLPVTVMLIAGVVVACGDDPPRACVTNESLGEVCAEGGDGSVVFDGRGLLPGSEVVIGSAAVGESTYVVGQDGTFSPDGRGVLSAISGRSLTFQVEAVDEASSPIVAELVIPV